MLLQRLIELASPSRETEAQKKLLLVMDDLLTFIVENVSLDFPNSPSKDESQNGDEKESQVTPQKVIDALPRYTVRKNGAYSNSETFCGLCQSKYNVMDRVKCLPCRHTFHEYCIENWLKWVRASCPVDRKSVIRKNYLMEIEKEK
ncbi:RING-type domain-containing protein [Nephila pilipes]|uniref:RING-type domain-containing protein n=1 Tax=Nephila pilipes TaxID=299642 RepID=A0A8X6PXQ1_NEPPI|nr:RING-type domain-containing protein [Nephila pilipes]